MSYEIKAFEVKSTDNIHTLKGKIYIGETSFESGPDGVFPANKL